MTERERRPGSGGTEDNARDELDEASSKEQDASREAVEEEQRTGGTQDNVRDEMDESQGR